MSDSANPIEDLLGEHGSLAGILEDFECRPSQMEMARRIREAVRKKIPCIIEAGTGTGKTMGYLVPVLLSGKKTVISTGTKNLQEQIFFKDIPILAKASGRPVDAMMMKGRKNYLCLHQYHQHFSQSSFLDPKREKVRKRIEKWLKKTTFADRGELPWIKDDDPVWDTLSANPDQCLGTRCFHWDDCYLNELRRRAAQARIIIVNHHLFFADLMVKKGGFGEILPRFQIAVFDEAHTIEEIATTYFGRRLSTNQLTDLINDMEREIKAIGDTGKKTLKRSLDLIRTGVEHLRDLFNAAAEKARLTQESLEMIRIGPAHEIREGLKGIYLKSGLESLKGASLQAYGARAEELDQGLQEILSSRESNWLNWYERRKRNLVLHLSPLDISQEMDECLYQHVRTLVFTSATLSTNRTFDYLRSRLGLKDPVLEGVYPSHFDFRTQSLLYIPRDLPPPSDRAFGPKVAGRVLELLEITEGRALVLFTSYHNLDLVHALVADKIPYTVYKQGDAPKSILLDAFRKDTHSVLLATGSFWQGVDVPGEALSCLIIDKLPFDSPGDPLVAARIDSIRARNGNPFMEYQLPSAIISLKQGLGRLIRNSSDRGVLCILDIRMITSRYGRFFFESLPEIPLRHELADVEALFEGTP
jgi:ATP-dependent DNA helicase DinG